jgi:hypothetical protein
MSKIHKTDYTYHLIYQITNTINGKIYIGKHETYNIDDGYMGSGTLIKEAIRKYGKENFTKEILFMIPTREGMDIKEAEIVTEAFVRLKSNYNIKPGGTGGYSFPQSDVTSEDMSKRGRLGGLKSKGNTKNLKMWTKGDAPPNCLENLSKMNTCPIIRQTRKDTFARIEHQVGETNSQFGTCWMHNDSKSIKIKLEDLKKYIADGYVRGRKIQFD